jgi:hypothetical protein
MDMMDGIIVGAAAAAVGTIVAFKFLNNNPQGGGQPNQPGYGASPNAGMPRARYVVDLDPTPDGASPVAQVNPITEAAYNVQPVTFEAGFGPGVNQAQESVILPQ